MLVRRTLSLDTERDAGLLAWLDAQDNASEAIRNALRAYTSTEVTLGEVYQAIKTLEAQVIDTGRTRGLCTTMENLSEDPDLTLLLDRLGL